MNNNPYFQKKWTALEGLEAHQVARRIKSSCSQLQDFLPEAELISQVCAGTHKRVLDFGCGMGRNILGLLEYAQQDIDIVGFDNSAMLKYAWDWIGGVHQNVELTSDWFLLRKQGFDAIFCSLVLQHMRQGDIVTRLNEFAQMSRRLTVLSRECTDEGLNVMGIIEQSGCWDLVSKIDNPSESCHEGHWLAEFQARQQLGNGYSGFRDEFQDIGRTLYRAGVFGGSPLRDFEQTSRHQLAAMLMSGLSPSDIVLDIGCGCLRSGVWLIHFLDDSCYFGVEPNRNMLQSGMNLWVHVFGEQMFSKEGKDPKFSHCDDWFFSKSFSGTQFDVFTAMSVWSHSPKWAIELQLDEFANSTASVFVLSYLPTQDIRRDYKGGLWVGRSHQSDQPGVVCHYEPWVKEQCHLRGFMYSRLNMKTLGQQWVVISR